MGATVFTCAQVGASAKDAFNEAIRRATYDSGNEGYTGTIAEKSGFVVIDVDPEYADQPYKYAEKLIDECDDRVDDKWGPAGCIKLGDSDSGGSEYMFFGWASS